MCGALRDLVAFVQFKKREKHPWRSVNFSKVKFYKCYQIAQRIRYGISAKNLCLKILKSDAKFEEKLYCCFKNDKNLVNFDPSNQVSKICNVICPFCAKHVKFNQKKYRGVIFNDTNE